MTKIIYILPLKLKTMIFNLIIQRLHIGMTQWNYFCAPIIGSIIIWNLSFLRKASTILRGASNHRIDASISASGK